MYLVSRIPYPVSRYPVPHIPYSASCLLYPVCRTRVPRRCRPLSRPRQNRLSVASALLRYLHPARTLRDAPADAEAASHKLLIRGGFMRQLHAGHAREHGRTGDAIKLALKTTTSLRASRHRDADELRRRLDWVIWALNKEGN